MSDTSNPSNSMATYDPIPDVARFGYTVREAAFLYLVGKTSGVFLRRQCCQFFQRRRGGIAHRFIAKAAALGHIRTVDYGQNRHIYHLTSRTVYRLLGEEESQNRRAKGDQEIMTKLMSLDYILQRRVDKFLASPAEKRAYFHDALLALAKSPAVDNSSGTSSDAAAMRIFGNRFPVFPAARDGDIVRFTFIDPGAVTVSALTSFLNAHKPLFDHLGRFELAFVASSARNFRKAESAFLRLFPTTEPTSDLLPFGPDHLIMFFAARRRWDQNDPEFSHADLRILKEGERIYTRPEHARLWAAYRADATEFQAELSALRVKTWTQGRLILHLLKEIYPVYGHRYKGKPTTPNSESRVHATFNFGVRRQLTK